MLDGWDHKQECKPCGSAQWLDYRTYDFFGKMDDCAKTKTRSTNYFSVCAALLALYLSLNEVYEFNWSTTTERYTADEGLADRYKFTMNITFHSLPCDEVEVNCLDYTGEPHLHLTEGLRKLQMRDGVVQDEDNLPLPPGDDICLPCYDAGETAPEEDEDGNKKIDETKKGKKDNTIHKPGDTFWNEEGIFVKQRCCNTCHELRDAYSNAGLEPRDAKNKPQCRNVGCRLEGDANVIKVAGDVRITAGTMLYEQGKFFHDVDTDDLVYYGFNISHTIHSLRFGHDHALDDITMPLDGYTADQTERFSSFVYDVEFVPTEYVDFDGNSKHTHQYIEKHYSTTLEVVNGVPEGVPGLYLLYNFSPLLLRVESTSDSLTRLFVTIVVIVGGVFGVFRFLETLLGGMCRSNKATI